MSAKTDLEPVERKTIISMRTKYYKMTQFNAYVWPLNFPFSLKVLHRSAETHSKTQMTEVMIIYSVLRIGLFE